MEKIYRQQVSLLLSVLPEVAKENCLALHGGTAINLFVRDMPRLSVDIDLTYLPIEDRESSLKHIAEALERIKANIEKVVRGARITPRLSDGKLQISANKVVDFRTNKARLSTGKHIGGVLDLVSALFKVRKIEILNNIVQYRIDQLQSSWQNRRGTG